MNTTTTAPSEPVKSASTPRAWQHIQSLRGTKSKGGLRKQVQCPAHDDKQASLSTELVTGPEVKVLVKCHAGCDTEKDVLPAWGMTWSDLYPPQVPVPTLGRVVKEYIYKKADGSVNFKVIRREPKGFRQAQPDGHGGWIPNVEGVERTLYRLDELGGKGYAIFVEGEKDADNLFELGFRATTTAGGATKSWEPQYTEQLKSVGITRVFVIPDNDRAGRTYKDTVGSACHAAGLEVKTVELPDLPDKGDTSDWIAAGGTKPKLEELLKVAPIWEPAAETELQADQQVTDDDGDKPLIVTNQREDLDSLNEETFDRVVAVNRLKPTVFQRGMSLARVRNDEDGRPIIESFSEAAFTGYLARTFNWMMWKMLMSGKDKDGEAKKTPKLVAVRPPAAVVKNILSRPEWDGVHPIKGIVQVPIFAYDGTLIQTPGYHPKARVWYAPEPEFTVSMPDKPTKAQIEKASALLMEALHDFPFDGPASRAHAVALILLPYVREFVDGPTPLHVVDAPTQGAGKGMICEIGAVLATGRDLTGASMPRQDENEVRKVITAKLNMGNSHILFDNIDGLLQSSALASVLTMPIWDDRILGVSESKQLPNRSIWMATGINVQMARDLARRSVVCRLMPKEEDPYLRTDFLHPELIGWVKENRSALVSACLTLARAWIVAGRPTAPHAPIGSFGRWADVMAGLLAVAGVPGFLENFKDTAAAVDSDTEEWRAFVLAWAERYGDEVVQLDALEKVALDGQYLPEVVGTKEKPTTGKFRRVLHKLDGRVFARWEVKKLKKGKQGARYQLVKIDSDPKGPQGGGGDDGVVTPSPCEFPRSGVSSSRDVAKGRSDDTVVTGAKKATTDWCRTCKLWRCICPAK